MIFMSRLRGGILAILLLPKVLCLLRKRMSYLFTSKIRLLTKALRPLPDKFHGLADQELRYRQRYLDILVNPEVKGVFQARANIIQYIRQFLVARRYIEVETL